MNLVDLIAEVQRRGVRIVPQGDKLGFGPASALTPELREQVRARKGEILVALHGDGRPLNACWMCLHHEFHRVDNAPRWICSRCHPPFTGSVIRDRWTAPEPSLRGALP